MVLSKFFPSSMVFAHLHKARLHLCLLSQSFLTIRQNSLYVTTCILARTLSSYFTPTLQTQYFYYAWWLATRLLGNYLDWTCTSKNGPALLDAQNKIRGVIAPLYLCFIILFMASSFSIRILRHHQHHENHHYRTNEWGYCSKY
jgi:hypothetical protein